MIKGIRRSLKGEKRTSSSSSSNQGGLTPKSKLATTPPKKIIRAIYDYNAQGPGELSFSKGDFLYVVGSENAVDWYEACDPPSNLHGMVPVAYFEVVSRQESIHTIPLGGAGGSAASTPVTVPMSTLGSGATITTLPAVAPPTGGLTIGGNGSIANGDSSPESLKHQQRISRTSNSSLSNPNRSPLYGIVLYDFKAERPDELQANSGESIIVIAQSNEEWFVAKPIGRLGGPGLIPISYVQIREVGSDKPVDDVHSAIKSAGVPKVEEWKRMAAEYKASSIPLGKFDDDNQAALAVSRQLTALSLQKEREKERERHRSTNTTGSSIEDYGGAVTSGNGGITIGTSPIASNPNPIRNSNAPYVINASVDRYAFDGGRYWYLVVAELSNGKFRNLCRYYQDFYDFQIKLLDEFPDEAGRTGKPRSLPFMPGPLTYVNDSISSQRRANLDDYVRNLIMMPAYVSRSPIVQQLFALRTGDVETPYQTNIMPQPPTRENGEAYEQQPQQQSQQQQQQQQYEINGGGGVHRESSNIPNEVQETNHSQDLVRDSSISTSTQNIDSTISSSAVSISSLERQSIQHHETLSLSPIDPNIPKSHSRMASESTVTAPLSHQRQPSSNPISSLPQTVDDNNTLVINESAELSNPNLPSDPSSTIPTPPSDAPSIKVKVFYQDDLIAIKIPSTITFAALHQRIGQRLGLENPALLHKDDDSTLNEISNDEEFKSALGDKSKLVLYAR